MQFLIADTFTDSLARLTRRRAEGRQDHGVRPATQSGQSRHELPQARQGEGQNFWSVRASGDIRLIVHRSEGSLLLCYAGHHDDAYAWAERRKLETHPKTGAAQLVEIRETVKEIVVPVYVQTEIAAKPLRAAEKTCLFAGMSGRRTARLRRARRVDCRREAGDRGHAAGARRPPARRGRGGAAGTRDRRQAARAAARRQRPIPSIIPMRSAVSA